MEFYDSAVDEPSIAIPSCYVFQYPAVYSVLWYSVASTLLISSSKTAMCTVESSTNHTWIVVASRVIFLPD